ncbi:hypothetical protein BC826DRAFT_1102650 [Russula brevipes]|nr:hypothetical protein BC826DRAFT_1102650 [Russula brevipes]
MASVSAAVVPKQLPRSRVPGAFDVAPVCGATPVTHILAVQSSPSSKHPAPDTIFLVPTHHIVLAANCAHIPHIPVLHPQMRSNGMLAIPVMPLVVPHAEAFAPLHTFLVAHRLDRLMSTLLHVPPSMLAGARPGTSAPTGPFAHISAPSAIWRNTCALGTFDWDFWAALDFSWEVILGLAKESAVPPPSKLRLDAHLPPEWHTRHASVDCRKILFDLYEPLSTLSSPQSRLSQPRRPEPFLPTPPLQLAVDPQPTASQLVVSPSAAAQNTAASQPVVASAINQCLPP